jgi:hypothetical protein
MQVHVQALMMMMNLLSIVFDALWYWILGMTAEGDNCVLMAKGTTLFFKKKKKRCGDTKLLTETIYLT